MMQKLSSPILMLSLISLAMMLSGCAGEFDYTAQGDAANQNTKSQASAICQAGNDCCLLNELICLGDPDKQGNCACYKAWACQTTLNQKKCAQARADVPDGQGTWTCHLSGANEICERPVAGTFPSGLNGWKCTQVDKFYSCTRLNNTPDGVNNWSCLFQAAAKICTQDLPASELETDDWAGMKAGSGSAISTGTSQGSGTGTGSAAQAARCGDGIINDQEQCDGAVFGNKTCATQGFAGGELTCNANCTLNTSACYKCGDGKINGAEECDGYFNFGGKTCASLGFVSGMLMCTAQCTISTLFCNNCGNGKIDAGEQCDGNDLGGWTCSSRGYTGGSLSCSLNCTLDTSACTSSSGCGC